ncbi:hypothetical protein [Methylobacterium sp. V23]|uniref:hypothetical protein n=1 Tax=Methylobacterium sp. V23 TaxID=2044878 RepID=UPI000CDA9BD8|nr:hypothetical protein [Methylobacterium sp. V23]POR42535.1 hypothetical protein CRT23_12135 [Methylobacterium sp. V23]
MASYEAHDPRDSTRERMLDVDFTIDSYGAPARTFCLPEDSDPGEPAEITLEAAFDITGADVLSLLTTEQQEAIESEVLENFDFDGGEDDWDGDL